MILHCWLTVVLRLSIFGWRTLQASSQFSTKWSNPVHSDIGFEGAKGAWTRSSCRYPYTLIQYWQYGLDPRSTEIRTWPFLDFFMVLGIHGTTFSFNTIK
uniref:Secreted protein n=1 Tax=Lepeophtheirus salmonis TaxID=72036 RepID=A0A0K2VBY4_LEPSM